MRAAPVNRTNKAGREVDQAAPANPNAQLELNELEQRGTTGPEDDAKRRALEQLRWRLRGVVRRAAANDFEAAA